jgi:zinc transporter ZupT
MLRGSASHFVTAQGEHLLQWVQLLKDSSWNYAEPQFGMHPALYALVFGTASGLSLPLASWLGITFSPVRNETCALMMAFGAGALLFAVTVELYGHALREVATSQLSLTEFFVIICGAYLGGAFYLTINGWLEDYCKEDIELTTSMAASSGMTASRSVGKIPSHLSGDDESVSTPVIATPTLERKVVTFRQQIEDDDEHRMRRAWTESPGETTALMKDLDTEELEQQAEEMEQEVVEQLEREELEEQGKIEKPDWKKRWQAAKAKAQEARKRAETEVGTSSTGEYKLSQSGYSSGYSLKSFKSVVVASVVASNRLRGREKAMMKSMQEKKDIQHAKSVALALFVGLLVDGVPEGILMGFLAAEGHLTPVLIVSLFIANFPEAFSSSSLLVQARMSPAKIIGMWTGLCLIVGILAGASCWLLLLSFPHYGHGNSHLPLPVLIGISLTEGITGGAMITCIASVMLPESFERAGKEGPFYSQSGFQCLSGFLLSAALKGLLG